jgi:hypothetical protein
MTEITFNKKAFLETLTALETQFKLSSNDLLLETEENGQRFVLEAKRSDGPEVRAFGPCQVKGEPVKVNFDLKEVENAVRSAHEGADSDSVTLLIGDGLWVKDPIDQ